MVKIKVNEYLLKSARAGLAQQRNDGSLIPGHNGPWGDEDTPTRITSHWTIVFSRAYKISNDEKFKKAALLAYDYLSSSGCRPHGFSFHCRDTKNKCNGLIGQAWAMEALLEIGTTFNEKKALSLAEEVALQHPFHKNLGLWFNLEINGKKLKLNRVLNQQVWFCAMVQRIVKQTGNPILRKRVCRFLKKLPRHIDFNQEYISHLIYTKFDNKLMDGIWRKIAKTILPLIFKKANLKQLSQEYLSFLLLGLSFLEGWEDIELVRKNVNYLNKNLFDCPNAVYAWTYNPTGFEVAQVIKKFGIESEVSVEAWIKKQLELHFNEALMDKNTNNPLTLAARIYELPINSTKDSA